jgi:cytochrome c
MKTLRLLMLSIATLTLVFGIAYAAGDVAKGRALFNDPKLSGATTGKSCNSCHLNGKGLEKAADKKGFEIMGKKQKGLEDAVNFCIEMALKGKAIDPKGADMADITTYIKSLGGKTPQAEQPAPVKKKKIEGC